MTDKKWESVWKCWEEAGKIHQHYTNKLKAGERGYWSNWARTPELIKIKSHRSISIPTRERSQRQVRTAKMDITARIFTLHACNALEATGLRHLKFYHGIFHSRSSFQTSKHRISEKIKNKMKNVFKLHNSTALSKNQTSAASPMKQYFALFDAWKVLSCETKYWCHCAIP